MLEKSAELPDFSYFDEPVWRVKIQTTPLPALQQNSKCFTTEQCFEASLFVKNVFNLIIKGANYA